MSVAELNIEPFSSLILEARQRPRITLHWEPERVQTLRKIAEAEGYAPFHRASARGQLAAADGNFKVAEDILLSTLLEFKHLYPANLHLFACVVELALAAQVLEVVSKFLNDRHKTPGLFVVNFHRATDDPTINLIAVDKHGKCQFPADPRMPGAAQADYLVGHWLGSAPLWASYCLQLEREIGKTLMNSGEHGRKPGLAYCGNKAEHFLIPDVYFLKSYGYQDLRARYTAARTPWDSRLPIAFWRGTTTGIRTGEMNWQSLPRIRLCQLSLKSPKLLDAGISRIVQAWHESDQEQIESAGLVRGTVPEEEFLKFRYQIDIDGNSNSWPGLYQKLLTGGPVLKVSSPHGFNQWYYHRLRPWVNFVPVASDLSDLIEKIEWLRVHDDVGRQIGERGKALAESLDYEGELERSRRTITAAIRYAAGKPETTIQFDSSAASSGVLLNGWCQPEDGGVATLGMESGLELPHPVAADDFVLALDLSPSQSLPSSSTQRLVVVVNGEILKQSAISTRQTINCMLARRVIYAAPVMRITLLHPDGRSAASATSPLDERVLSVVLHRLELTPASVFSVDDKPTPPPRVTGMPPRESRQGVVMKALYGRDIWHGFVPTRPREDEIQGWNGRHPVLRRLLAEIANKTVIDVGVWKGQSTVFIAEAMRQSTMDGCVVAIDTFLWPELWTAEGKLFSRHPGGRTDVHDVFLDNVFRAGVSDWVVPLPLATVAAVDLLARHDVKAGLVHLDASRNYSEVLQDAEAYWPLIEPGGYLIGDDYGPSWPGVVRAAQEFAAKTRQELVIEGPKWLLKKPTK